MTGLARKVGDLVHDREGRNGESLTPTKNSKGKEGRGEREMEEGGGRRGGGEDGRVWGRGEKRRKKCGGEERSRLPDHFLLDRDKEWLLCGRFGNGGNEDRSPSGSIGFSQCVR
ncbi:hypothetical protein VI817_004670 [Penicillium citrinum]|nr:hypothetical protein VI817_004670 [Penicillium citrinum]